jgi:hypothetical protein
VLNEKVSFQKIDAKIPVFEGMPLRSSVGDLE